MKNLVDILDLSTREIDSLISVAEDIMASPEKYRDACHGRILATLFFEPSTRTRLSFTSAMMSLGGNVLGFDQAASTSVAKGETLSDTIRMVSAYSDIIAMRHPKEGAPIVASGVSDVPVINAGDGGHFHPTQTLTDLLTIKEKLGRLDHLTVGVVGDLKYGRTVHSLISAMSRYEGNSFVLISPDELKLPDYVKEEFLGEGKSPYVETTDLESAIPSVDILYMTRIQGERFADRDEFERLRDVYILDSAKLKLAKPTLSILHPLPRVNEISVKVDNDPRAAYFRQALNGKFMRMALILKLLKEAEDGQKDIIDTSELIYDHVCHNPKCITAVEQELPQVCKLTDRAANIHRCIYCEQKV